MTSHSRGTPPPNLRAQECLAGPCCASCRRWSTADGESGLCFRANGPKRATVTAWHRVCDDHSEISAAHDDPHVEVSP
jgi:hypothetical protein